jgi:hypothetical protein
LRYGGWMMILSGPKTLLETGETLTTPGSLRYESPSQGVDPWHDPKQIGDKNERINRRPQTPGN